MRAISGPGLTWAAICIVRPLQAVYHDLRGPLPPSPKPKRKALWLVRSLSRFLATVFSTWKNRGRSAWFSLGQDTQPSPAYFPAPTLVSRYPLTSSTLPSIPYEVGSGQHTGAIQPFPEKGMVLQAGRDTRERLVSGLRQSWAFQSCPDPGVTWSRHTLCLGGGWVSCPGPLNKPRER